MIPVLGLAGCLPSARTNARLDEGLDVAASVTTSRFATGTNVDEMATTDNTTGAVALDVQYAHRLEGGDGLALQVKLSRLALDLYYAFPDHEGDQWFFGVGAEAGYWGKALGGGFYGVATHYFHEHFYVSFTPRIVASEVCQSGYYGNPTDRSDEKVLWLNPQLALGVSSGDYVPNASVDLSVFLSHVTFTGVGYNNFRSGSYPVSTDGPNDFRESYWMLGGEARF
jgi:hypothetical protein